MALNLGAPLSTQFQLWGLLAGVAGTSPGTAFIHATTGWQAAVIADNPPTAATGGTYGLVLPINGPTFGIYDTDKTGLLISSDPGDTCSANPSTCVRTLAVDHGGNITSQGTGHFQYLMANQGLAASGLFTAGLGAQLGGRISFRNSAATGNPTGADETAYVDGNTGNIYSLGTLKTGVLTVATLGACASANEGTRSAISDAVAPTFLGTLTGGGTVHSPAYCNGTNWVAG